MAAFLCAGRFDGYVLVVDIMITLFFEVVIELLV